MVPIIFTRLALRGIDGQGVLRESGLPDSASSSEITAPLSRINQLVEVAGARFGDDYFGLTLAEWIPPGAFGFPEFVMRSAPTVKQSLQSLCDFAALINPIGRFTLTIDEKTVSLDYFVKARRAALGIHLNEYTLHLMIRMCAGAVDGELPLDRAWLPHLRPSSDAIAARIGCPVELGAANVGFAIRREFLDRRPRQADEALFAFLSEQSRKQLASSGTDDVVSRVIRVLEDRLAEGDLTVEAVASAMAMTSRSLQRRLEGAGTSFREVLDHVRHRRCRELRRAGMIWEDIAVALGFSDTRALRRAAERWEEPDS